MKSGFVVLVGRSNVGKSTLLNTLVGTKIAATSFRAQMTRHVIHGVMNLPAGQAGMPDGQAIFLDTPGVFKDRRNPLTAKLYNKVTDSLTDVDVIIYVVDPTREIGEEERAVYGLVRHLKKPKLLVINKSDLHENERSHQEAYEQWSKDFDGTFVLSALRASHIQPLKEKVIELLPEGEALYLDEQLTNIDSKFWIGEIIREKVYSFFEKEVPYSITVEVDDVVEKPSKDGKETVMVISARILTNQERYKRMIIGSGGKKVKEIGQMARKELEQSVNKKIFLELEVEVDPHWVERV